MTYECIRLILFWFSRLSAALIGFMFGGATTFFCLEQWWGFAQMDLILPLSIGAGVLGGYGACWLMKRLQKNAYPGDSQEP